MVQTQDRSTATTHTIWIAWTSMSTAGSQTTTTITATTTTTTTTTGEPTYICVAASISSVARSQD